MPDSNRRLGLIVLSISEWFRLFVGDLSNDVSDDVLANAFNKYPSFTKARVIRDRLSQKVFQLFDNIYLILITCITG